jgi:CBS domain-containing protein
MKVRELAHRPATTCALDTSIAEAARLMKYDNVGCVIVLDAHARPAGIITDRDIAVRAVAEETDNASPVRDFMTPNVVFLYENADVFAAAGEMAQHGIRRLPVLDEQGNIVGVLSLDDLIVILADQAAQLSSAVRKEIFLAPV